ncbi:hypothetical protein M8C21_028425 [Ambrosia artemisiifolia]|uniref:Peptidase C1A papain C-terminal domain-containing protein n=1 Tax=Ambrosia artemisiifolia TaxID=4212 RepID=A0AAD5CKC8_AMBAR|nr:hypothetical protein M8C21_028425 [Ambrosia artemisiifolia]
MLKGGFYVNPEAKMLFIIREPVRCDTSYKQGYNGGLMDYAFEFIINNSGIDTEEDYPYTGKDGKCDKNKEKRKATNIQTNEELAIKLSAEKAEPYLDVLMCAFVMNLWSIIKRSSTTYSNLKS